MARVPLAQKYFCEICKVADETLKFLEECDDCGLILLCRGRCAQLKSAGHWPIHEKVCKKRKMDIQKWLSFIPSSGYFDDTKAFAQHRFKVAFETLEMAEKKQDLFTFRKALQVLENAIFITCENINEKTAFDVKIYDNFAMKDYSALKITSAYLYLLLTLGKADDIQYKFIDAEEETPFKKLGMASWQEFPTKKRHFLAKFAEILVIFMKADIPERVTEAALPVPLDLRKLPINEGRDILRKKGVGEEEIKRLSRWDVSAYVHTLSTGKVKAEPDGQGFPHDACEKLKKIFGRIYVEKTMMHIICTGQPPPLWKKGKRPFDEIEVALQLRKYFAKYPKKTAYLYEMWNRFENGEEEMETKKAATEDPASDNAAKSIKKEECDIRDSDEEDDMDFVDFMCSMGMGLK